MWVVKYLNDSEGYVGTCPERFHTKEEATTASWTKSLFELSCDAVCVDISMSTLSSGEKLTYVIYFEGFQHLSVAYVMVEEEDQ